jgi:L-ascorbate metabolism protein UlaG (beta-lactamase superfamily)
MRLDYLAHSCFLLEKDGYRVVFDPYNPIIGYPPLRLASVDLIVVSHDHDDHNAVSQVSGACQVARGVARRSYGPLVLDGEVGWHGEGDDADPVSLTVLEWADKRLAHFGDLGCSLDPSHLNFFQRLDLLLLPCGGGYTIDGARAADVVRKLRPKLVVPMHYATPFLSREQFPEFQSAQPFLEACKSSFPVVNRREGWVDLDEMWSANEETTVLYLQHQMG